MSSPSVGLPLSRSPHREGRLAVLHPSPALLRRSAVGVALAALALAVVMRRVDALQRPQFWAEDGRNWFAEAYNNGRLATLVIPHTGYFQTLARLVADVGVTLGLGAAPLVSNSVALALELAPAALLLTPRFAAVVPSLWLRVLLAAAYIAVPSAEVHGNITNAHWHLALLACMVFLVPGSARRAWQVFDIAVLVLCGLSGPFVILLVPVGLLRFAVTRDRRDLTLVAIAVPMALLQGISTLANIDSRSDGPLGASVTELVRIIANRVVINGLLSTDADTAYLTQAFPHGLLVAAILATTAAAVFALVMWRGPLPLKLFDLFAVLVLAITLARAQLPPEVPQWVTLGETDGGSRYFVIPDIAWVMSVAWLITLLPRRAAIAVGTVVAVGFLAQSARHWTYAAYPDLDPGTYSQRLDQAPAGTQLRIPINPSGWDMVLVKH